MKSRKHKASVRDFGRPLSPADVNSINKKFYDSQQGITPTTAAKQSPQTPDEINQANQHIGRPFIKDAQSLCKRLLKAD